jgi:hypothetical protein
VQGTERIPCTPFQTRGDALSFCFMAAEQNPSRYGRNSKYFKYFVLLTMPRSDSATASSSHSLRADAIARIAKSFVEYASSS